ncbi:MAG: hypothetical protein ACK5Q5_03605 [Planctomycetaceae bacterium]
MTKPPSRTSAPQLKLSPRTLMVLFAAVVVYLLLRPTLSGWLGMELPGLFPEESAVVQAPAGPAETGPLPEGQSPPTSSERKTQTVSPRGDLDVSPSPPSSDPLPSKPSQARPSEGGSVVKVSPSSPGKVTTSTKPSTKVETTPATSTTSRSDPPSMPQTGANTSARPPPSTPKPTLSVQAKLGQLTNLGGKRFRSTAGLIYVQERSEHRIDHVLRHGKDDQSRPVHGVFNGDRDTILAVIDEAWQLAQKGRPPKVEVEDQGDRTVYVVDLGRKIGYMGGQAGKRKRFPPCRHLQLVVEGNEVVTAYPTIPR